jgi:hypothetical protein
MLDRCSGTERSGYGSVASANRGCHHGAETLIARAKVDSKWNIFMLEQGETIYSA